MPPIASTSSISPMAFWRACVSDSMQYEPPHGSDLRDAGLELEDELRVPRDADVGGARWPRRRVRVEAPALPKTAAMASTGVRMMLLYGSCS
jgi:hypothetical protein